MTGPLAQLSRSLAEAGTEINGQARPSIVRIVGSPRTPCEFGPRIRSRLPRQRRDTRQTTETIRSQGALFLPQWGLAPLRPGRSKPEWSGLPASRAVDKRTFPPIARSRVERRVR